MHCPLCRNSGRVRVHSPITRTRYCPACAGGSAYHADRVAGGADKRRRGWERMAFERPIERPNTGKGRRVRVNTSPPKRPRQRAVFPFVR